MMHKVLLIISGGIAAYKSLELIRLLTARNVQVTAVLTEAAARFVTPLSVAALTGQRVHTELFNHEAEAQMGHIQLSRMADLLVVAPASADILAKAAHGLAGDLVTTALLATDKPVLMAPAMNVRMWLHAAAQANVATLLQRGVGMIGPDDGAMACGEFGPGRMAEPAAIAERVYAMLGAGAARSSAQTDAEASEEAGVSQAGQRGAVAGVMRGRHALVGQNALVGRHALVTAGPTIEPIDPVRFISNRSSGKQGYAIAGALAALGARVTLVSGPTGLDVPAGVDRVSVQTAREMLDACERALPADVAVCVAAVADFRPAHAAELKLEKASAASLALVANPDILATLSAHAQRPALVIGFAAQTHEVETFAQAKLAKKRCDWIVANDVSGDVMGGDHNQVSIISDKGIERLARTTKAQVAAELAGRIASRLGPRE